LVKWLGAKALRAGNLGRRACRAAAMVGGDGIEPPAISV
jgi:hypothetical protein